MADLQRGCVLARVFKETAIPVVLNRGQVLTTYAYEIGKVQRDKLMPVNFIHLTKAEFGNESRLYNGFPRLVTFGESETVRTVGQKIYFALRPILQ